MALGRNSFVGARGIGEIGKLKGDQSLSGERFLTRHEAIEPAADKNAVPNVSVVPMPFWRSFTNQ